jgi:hypothetical protein
LEFYTYLPKQKRNTKSSSNPFNAKISFEAYLLIPEKKNKKKNLRVCICITSCFNKPIKNTTPILPPPPKKKIVH